jgi:signal transduction histidine kinase
MTRRVLASIIGVTVVALALFGIPLAIAFRNQTQKDEFLELARIATQQSARVSQANVARARVVDFVAVEPEMRVGVYNAAGRRVAGTGPEQIEPALSTALRGDTPRQQGPWSAAATPIVSDGHIIGATRVGESRSDVNQKVLKAWSLLGLLGLAVLGITIALAYWQSRRLTRPLTRLAAASTRIGDGDFTVRSEPSGIAEIDAVGNALDVTAARVGDAIERERAFSADASHQLRTPLTSLRLTLERAERRPHADQELLADAISQVDKLDNTITQLLQLARDTHDDAGLLDQSALLNDLSKRWSSVLAQSGRLLVVEQDKTAPDAHASKTAVLHVLEILLDNAVTHGAGTVTVGARGARGGLAIEVSDEGAGISGDAELIFRRRHHKNGNEVPAPQNPGIGLALARRLAEAEGGRLVLSVVRPCPRFSLFLPVADGASDRQPREASRRHSPKTP